MSKNVFQGTFFLKFWPYVWLVFKSGFKSRAGYDGAHIFHIYYWHNLVPSSETNKQWDFLWGFPPLKQTNNGMFCCGVTKSNLNFCCPRKQTNNGILCIDICPCIKKSMHLQIYVISRCLTTFLVLVQGSPFDAWIWIHSRGWKSTTWRGPQTN